jgi:hypothetical protein
MMGKVCETCGLTRWEGRQVEGWVESLRTDLERYKTALKRLDGKVEPGWRQAVITRALRHSSESQATDPNIQANPKQSQDLDDGVNPSIHHEIARLHCALELVAAPRRPDGSWNRDREACRELAAAALHWQDSLQEDQ